MGVTTFTFCPKANGNPFAGYTGYRGADLRQISTVFSHFGMKDWSVLNLSLLFPISTTAHGEVPQLKVLGSVTGLLTIWLKLFITFDPK